MVEVVHLTSSTPKPGKGRGKASLKEDLNVPTVAKFTKEMFAQHRRSVCYGCNRRDILRQCAIHLRRLHSHDTSTQQPKVVQEVQAQEDQNTGKTKNVDIVEMIRSMGLREHQAKNSQNANVQEMSIVHDLNRYKTSVLHPSASPDCDNNLGKLSKHHGTRSLCSYTS